MEQNNIEMVSERILNRIGKGLTLQEEQRTAFWEYALEQIGKTENIVPEASLGQLFMLKEHVLKKWDYDEIGSLTPECAFEYGQLWGAFQLMDMADKRGKEKYSMEFLKKQYGKYYELFSLLKNSPGIRHKEVAEKIQKSPSEVSQIFAKLDGGKLFSTVKLGREKYYYLEERGNRLLEAMEKEKKKTADAEKWETSLPLFFPYTLKEQEIGNQTGVFGFRQDAAAGKWTLINRNDTNQMPVLNCVPDYRASVGTAMNMAVSNNGLKKDMRLMQMG